MAHGSGGSQRGLALAEVMGHRYDLALTHLEMGRRLGERDSLECAQALLAEMGAARPAPG